MQREMELIANKEGSWGTGDDEHINVRGSTVTREVTATYLKVSKETWYHICCCVRLDCGSFCHMSSHASRALSRSEST